MTAARLYLRYIGISVRSQLQYRASTIMLAVGHVLLTGIEFVGLWALFHRFGSLRGWQLPEVALFYGMANVSFALAEGLLRGFDTFPGMVRGGDFDRLLLRPRSTAFQVAAREVQLMRIGRLSQGLVVLLWAAWALPLDWSAGRIALLLFTILGGLAFFAGLFVLTAVASFWTTDTLELINVLTYGSVQTAQYPLSIYRPWFRRLLTFIVPLAAVSYFPLLAVLGRPDEAFGAPLWFQCLSPLVGVLFFAGALLTWRVGVRHYRSTGS